MLATLLTLRRHARVIAAVTLRRCRRHYTCLYYDTIPLRLMMLMPPPLSRDMLRVVLLWRCYVIRQRYNMFERADIDMQALLRRVT